jgi:pheromone shutdown protein TraB
LQVNGSHAVVGIVGKGHLPGVVHALTEHHGKLLFRDLAGSRRQRGDLKFRIVRRLAFEVGLLVLSIWLYDLWVNRPGA